MRLFIALFPPPEVQTEVIQRLSALSLDGIPWVRPANLHLTLKFIGNTGSENVPIFQRVLTSISRRYAPFSLTLAGAGAFPDEARPRILWTGLKGEFGPLRAISQELEETLEEHGFSQENRRYSPHMTLARLKRSDPAVLAEFFRAFSGFESHEFVVSQLELVDSALKPDTSVYSRFFKAPLAS